MIMKKNCVVLVIVLLLPIMVVSECTCDKSSDEGMDKAQALKYKLIAMAAILVAGAVGVSLPSLGNLIPAFSPENDIFHVIKVFAAGVILSTGMVHILPEAFESLGSVCLPENPWRKFPFAGFGAMVSAMGTLMVDCFATSYLNKSDLKEKSKVEGNGDVEMVHGGNGGGGPGGGAAAHGHSHGAVLSAAEDSAKATLLRNRVISQVLELGIIVHSVIIGVSLGTSENPRTIKPLIAALSFHQLFEGIGLGGCISQAQFKSGSAMLMSIFFSLTTPMGIVIGFGVSNIYNENSPKALIVTGIFNSASAGILIYMALVDLLAAEFMSPKLQNNTKLQLCAHIFLLLGAGCMSLLAKWA